MRTWLIRNDAQRPPLVAPVVTGYRRDVTDVTPIPDPEHFPSVSTAAVAEPPGAAPGRR